MSAEAEEILAEPDFLGYHGGVICPYCKKPIFIPIYRQQPGTLEDLREYGKGLLETSKKEKGEVE